MGEQRRSHYHYADWWSRRLCVPMERASPVAFRETPRGALMHKKPAREKRKGGERAGADGSPVSAYPCSE